MTVERQWMCDGVVSPGDANGQTCVFCGQRLVDESQPVHWVLRAVEDYQDSDFAVENGYAHRACSDERQRKDRSTRPTLPEVPEGPRRG